MNVTGGLAALIHSPRKATIVTILTILFALAGGLSLLLTIGHHPSGASSATTSATPAPVAFSPAHKPSPLVLMTAEQLRRRARRMRHNSAPIDAGAPSSSSLETETVSIR